MRALVMGGTRFLGVSTVATLLRADHEVIVVISGDHQYPKGPRASCIHNLSQVRIGVSLWQCPSEPTGNKDTWGSQGCAIVATGARALDNPKNGTQYTTYAPPDGTSGPTESGWYVGSAVTTGYDSLGQNIFVHTSIGNPGLVTPLGRAR